MADKNKKRNNNRNKDYDDDFNPKFKKNEEKRFAHYVVTRILY